MQKERFYIPLHDQMITHASKPALEIPVSPENIAYFKMVKTSAGR